MESWVFVVACLLFLITTAGISCIVLFVFGVWGPQVSDEELLQAQVEYLSTDPIVFEDPMSAQWQAIDWMVNVDESSLDWENDQVRRETRYALAVLCFSTGLGSDWIDPLEFLSAQHECAWNNEEGQGVACSSDLRVTSLTIVNNGLRGRLPVELSGLSDLEVLRLSSNVLTGSLPVLAFPRLDELNLSDNRLDGPVPMDFYAALPTLRHLNLSSNVLLSSLPTEWGFLLTNDVGPMVQLRALDLSKNDLTGTMDMIENFPSLEQLDLSSNQFTGIIPDSLGGLSNLEFVSLSENEIEGTIPSTIGYLTSLQVFDVGNNWLSGTFPWFSLSTSIGNMLTRLVFSKNSFTGPIPESVIVRYNRLEVIDFGRNLLTGNIPNGLGSMNNLHELDMSANKLDGTLPADLGFAGSLVSLSVAGNQLFGTIPATLGNSDSLVRLDLQGNQFFGTVPSSFDKLSVIERIGLYRNDLDGNIDFLCLTDPPPVISADCGGRYPQVLACSCSEVCYDSST